MENSNNNNKVFLNTILNKKNKDENVPIWLMRQAGRYLPEYHQTRKEAGSFLNLCYNSKLAEEVTLQPIRRFGFDASIVFADILVIPDAIGQKVDFKEGIGPVLEPITNLDDFKKLNLDNFDKFNNHLSPVYETLDRLTKSLPKETALIGFAGAPWTVATYMVLGRGKQDLTKCIDFAKNNPIYWELLIDRLVNFTSEYLINQIKAGAETLQIFDSWAGVLQGEDFINWSIIPIKKIVENIKKVYPDVPIIGFPKGADKREIDFIKQTGVDVISIEHGSDLEWVKENVQPICPVQGCLSPDTLKSGINLESEINEILTAFKDGRHIFNLGHGIDKDTPIENVEKLIKIVREYK